VKNTQTPAVASGFGLLIFYVLWIVFVGTFSSHELLIGIIGAALATAGLMIVNIQYPACFSPTMRQLLLIWRIPGYLFVDTWGIVAVAAKDLLGIDPAKSLFRVVPFATGAKDDACDVARRVLAVVYTTIRPGSIVLGVNVSSRQLLFHQIERGPAPRPIGDLGGRT